jgi:hypothetical protein
MAEQIGYEPQPRAVQVLTATIAAGNTVSDTLDVSGGTLFRIGIPADWTPAAIVLLSSDDGGTTFAPLLDRAGDPVTLPATSNRWINLFGPWVWPTITQLRIQSGMMNAPVPQEADRQITVVLE